MLVVRMIIELDQMLVWSFLFRFQCDVVELLRSDKSLVLFGVPTTIEDEKAILIRVLWKLRQNNNTVSYDELMTEADKIYEVQMTSKGQNIYRWTHMTKPVENLIKPYSITDLQA